jgi:hypothetical protein
MTIESVVKILEDAFYALSLAAFAAGLYLQTE